MKKFIKKGTVLVAAALLLTGCGDKMAVLTESEEAVIVNYSAGTLAKHNSYQQEGMMAVYPREKEEEPAEGPTPDTEEKEGQQGQGTEDGGEKGQEEAGEGQGASNAVNMTEALAVPGIEFSYKDYSTSDTYRQGEYFSLDAKEGNVFVILNVNMVNTGQEAVACDLLARQPIFTLKINEGSGVKNEITMLENDLSTYIGTVEPGQTVAGILLFEVPEETAEGISSLKLPLQMNETTTEINMG